METYKLIILLITLVVLVLTARDGVSSIAPLSSFLKSLSVDRSPRAVKW